MGVVAFPAEGRHGIVEERPADIPAPGHIDRVLHFGALTEDAHLLVGCLVEVDEGGVPIGQLAAGLLDVPPEAPAAVVALDGGRGHAVAGEHPGGLRLRELHRLVGVEDVQHIAVSVVEFRVAAGRQEVGALVGCVGVVLDDVIADGEDVVLPEAPLVHQALHRPGVLHILRIEDVGLDLLQVVELSEAVLEGPQRVLVAILIHRDCGQADDLPLPAILDAAFGLQQVAAKVALVEALHNDDRRRETGVGAGTDGVLVPGVHALTHHVGDSVLGLQGVIYEDSPGEPVAGFFRKQGGRLIVVEEVGVVHVVDLASAEAGDLAAGGHGVEPAADGGLPLLRAPVEDQDFGIEPPVVVALDGLEYLAAIVDYKVGRVGDVEEEGLRVHGQALRHKGLDELGLAIPGRDVDHRVPVLGVPGDDAVDGVGDDTVVLTDDVPAIVLHLEHIPGEIEGGFIRPRPCRVEVGCHISIPPPAFP